MTIIFLHWCLLRVVLLITLIIGLTFKPRSDVTIFVKSTIAAVRGKCFDTWGHYIHYIHFIRYKFLFNPLFNSVNSLVVSRNLWLILIMKILLFLNFVKHTLKHFYISKPLSISNMCQFFFCSFSGHWVIRNFVIFHKTTVAKHIWDPCCHLVAETGSWFILIILYGTKQVGLILSGANVMKLFTAVIYETL